MGVIRKETTDPELPEPKTVMKNICNAFLISQDLVASLGSCIYRMRDECNESFKDCEFSNGKKSLHGFELTSYRIIDAKHYEEYHEKNTTYDIDFGLIIVSSLIHVFI